MLVLIVDEELLGLLVLYGSMYLKHFLYLSHNRWIDLVDSPSLKHTFFASIKSLRERGQQLKEERLGLGSPRHGRPQSP